MARFMPPPPRSGAPATPAPPATGSTAICTAPIAISFFRWSGFHTSLATLTMASGPLLVRTQERLATDRTDLLQFSSSITRRRRLNKLPSRH
ncbi:hypothetical protein GQ55_2G039500 [Panicum hallii var. hallii]|uniref:Uncharacterized protein n=1 Tax=Panicum hallii var. hallii TaxID=1504633 RepID=A0A2T7EL69_9POAL|nr:hypothetical protein GQ55_2G039500 [Panicum hallii var. hallii]